MANFTRIKFGDYLNVTDEGGGVIRVDGCPCSCGSTTTCVAFPDRIAELVTAGNTLLGYWRLGETSDPWADTSGYSPAAPINIFSGPGSTAPTPNVSGALPSGDDDGAVQFNEGERIVAPEPTTPARFNLNSGPMTVSAWVMPLTTASTLEGNICGIWSDAGFGQCGWTLTLHQFGGSNEVYFSRRESGSPAQSATAGPETIGVDEWVFVVGVYDDATGIHSLYVNGVLVATDTSLLVTSLPTFNSGPSFGGYGGGSSSASVNAKIDEVSVWGSALTAEHISDLYTSGLPCASGTILSSSFTYVSIQTGVPPSTYLTPLVFDDTAVTGGLYAWDGSAYQQVGPPL